MLNINSKNLYFRKFLFFFFIILLLVLGVVFPLISFFTLLIISIYFLLNKNDRNIIELYVFLAPFASIFKYKAGTLSFFTIISILFVLKMFFKHGIPKKYFLFYIPYLLFCIVGITSDFSAVIKQFLIPFTIYYVLFNKGNIDKEQIFKIFVISMLIASSIGYFKSYVPNMTDYLLDKSLRLDVGVYTTRFSGLNGDPNYYGINILLSLALTFYLMIKKQIRSLLAFFIIALLLFFGSQTNSKSFILVLVGLIVFVFYSLVKNKRYFLFFVSLALAVVSIIMINNSTLTIFDNLINRFAKDTNISELTTGRSEIQKMYIDYINSNPRIFLIGNGFNSNLLSRHEAHNTYLQMIYNFGIVGTTILIYLILFGLKNYKIERNVVNYLPMIVIFVSYLGLSELKYYDFPIHMLIILLAICGQKKQSKYLEQVK